ncbi:MAG TPA: hypothetical protein VNH22_18235 [Blastocatellia bacterium]|jgi:anti-sigma factor RsiW|nr:hypothetical protein [Blastocatellia bacterium]
MNLNSPHTEFDELTDLAEGRLSPDKRSEVMGHLASCQNCSEELSRVEQTIELMRTDALEDAPLYVIERAARLLPSSARRSPSLLRRVLAALEFDSLQSSPAFGVRSGLSGERQLLFSAEQHEIQLQVSPSAEAWILSGQVLGPCDGGEAELRSHAYSTQARLNNLCEFVLPPVAGGTYTLTLRFADVELEVPDLKLGA